MTYIEAAIKVLRESGIPMSANELWKEIENKKLCTPSGKTPWLSLNSIMLGASTNSNIKNKSKNKLFTIVSKNPIRFVVSDDISEVIEEDFDMSESEIILNINNLKDASTHINRCTNEIDYLCESLNNVDRNYLHKYYNSDRQGPVINLRKEVAKEILLGSISSSKLTQIINENKIREGQVLKAWANPYRILHPFINYDYIEIDKFIDKFTKYLTSIMNVDVKTKICNFNGPQNQGSEEYWIAIYNSVHNSQSEGLQLFLTFKNGIFTCGIYNFFEDKYLSKIEFDGNLENLYDFIRINSEIILNDTEKSSDIVVKKIKSIIEENSNIGMTIKEIIEKMDTNISENNLRKLIDDSDIFELIGEKYKIKGQIPGTNKLKKYLTEQGFITIEILTKILEKNGIKLEDIDID